LQLRAATKENVLMRRRAGVRALGLWGGSLLAGFALGLAVDSTARSEPEAAVGSGVTDAPSLEGPSTGPSSDAALDLRVTLFTPLEGALLASSDDRVFVAGRAVTFAPQAERFDLVVVLDTSRSTAAPAGADIDGDGWLGAGRGGRWIDATSDDWGDTVLAAQIYAVRTLLSQLDPQTTRMGIVTFSGDGKPETPDAIRLAPLTHDFTQISRALDYLLTHRPRGYTHIAEGLDAAVGELLGEGRSRARDGATPVVLLLTDGQPTLPFRTLDENVAHTVAAGRLAAERGIRIDTFPIGEQANQDVRVMGTLAAVSGGRFTPVLQPADLMATFENIQITGLRALRVRNATTSSEAEAVMLEADGRFCAMLSLADGENLLEVEATDAAGRSTTREVRVRRGEGGRPPVLSPRLAKWETRLLENRLLDLYREELALGRARAAERRSLEVRMDPDASPTESPRPAEGERAQQGDGGVVPRP
jgi:hypothetical protein